MHFLCGLYESNFVISFVCQVTFDQQLYSKAVPMVLAAPPGSPLQRIIVRLGGFHLLKSFLGAIGNIMAGSGLEDCLEIIYAKNTVRHMISGDAFARSIRGHFLVWGEGAHVSVRTGRVVS